MLYRARWERRLIRAAVIAGSAGLVALAVMGGMALCDVLADWLAKKGS